MKLLHYVEIENFKRYGDIQRIELDHPAVLIGPNNCGKTSALQAIALWSIGLRTWRMESENSKAEKRKGKALNRLGETDRERLRALGRVAPSALQVHQALFGRPVSTIPAICATTGQSPHTVNKMLDEMMTLGLVREITGRKRNRIYEYTAYLELLNQE